MSRQARLDALGILQHVILKGIEGGEFSLTKTSRTRMWKTDVPEKQSGGPGRQAHSMG